MRAPQPTAPEPLLDGFDPMGSGWQRTFDLARFVLVEGGLTRDPVLIYAICASLSRSALIFSINNAVSNPGLHVVPLLILAASVITSLTFAHLAQLRTHRVVVSLQRNMRNALSRRLLQAGASFLQGRDHGQVYAVMTNEAYQVSSSAATVLQLIQAVLLLLICSPYLFWVSWPIGLATLAAVAIGGIGFTMTEIPARQLSVKVNEAAAAFCDRVNDMLAGWMELRLRKSRHDDLEADVTRITEDIRHYSIEAERYFTRGNTITQAAMVTLLCGIVVAFPYLQGSGGTTMFQLLTVILLAYGPIETIFSGLPSLSRAVAAQQMIAELVRDLSASREPPASVPDLMPARFRKIELRGLTARISDASGGVGSGDAFQLGPIDLVLEPGMIVFICGGNGAGKSTLLALLTGLRPPDSGEILVDGVPVTDENRSEYRQLFSAVFSQFHLFRKAYGLGEEERRQVNSLIAEFGLADRVSLSRGEFSTLSLSTGQKRRLALAVARSENRPVIVLDEFAADQDPARRAFFYDVMVPDIAAAGNLVLAVTHDEHAFARCDRLIKLESGRIVADRRVERMEGPEVKAELWTGTALDAVHNWARDPQLSGGDRLDREAHA